jgi:hypothetical protein
MNVQSETVENIRPETNINHFDFSPGTAGPLRLMLFSPQNSPEKASPTSSKKSDNNDRDNNGNQSVQSFGDMIVSFCQEEGVQNSVASKLEPRVEKAVDKAIEKEMAETKNLAKKRGIRNNVDDEEDESSDKSNDDTDNNPELYDSFEDFPGSDSIYSDDDNAAPTEKSKQRDNNGEEGEDYANDNLKSN